MPAMQKFAWLTVMAGAACGGSKETSCKDVVDHVHKVVRGDPSYLDTYIGEATCKAVSADTRACMAGIKNATDLRACSKTSPELTRLITEAEEEKLASDQRVASADVLAYRSAYKEWRANHPEASTCPTMFELEQQTSSPHTLRDRWGNEYVLQCLNGNVRVASPGPDKKLDTADDIGPEWVDPRLKPASP